MLGARQRVPETSLPGEIVANAEWYDFEAKYERGRDGAAGAGADLRGRRPTRVRELAAATFALAGCSGLARCDFFVEPGGEVLVNEINTMPGFTETSVYAKLLRGQRASPTRTSATASSRSPSSATAAPAPTSSEPQLGAA